MIQYWLYRLASLISRALPQGLAYWFGLRIADQYYRFNRAGREAVMANLRQIFLHRGIEPADQALRGFARKTFQYFGKYLVDFFRYAELTPAQLKHIISVQHRDYLQQCLDRKTGVLLLTAHFGNWELGSAVMSAMGHRITAVVLPQRLEKLNRLFQQQRERRGVRLIPLGSSALSILRCLKRGELVALLADRDFTARDDRVTFFGRPARIPKGPAWLAKKMGVPILPAFLVRQVDDTFLLRFHEPIIPGDGETEEALQQRVCLAMEKEIAEEPYQWFIFDNFWEAENPPGRSETT